jgi:hypothetical protein
LALTMFGQLMPVNCFMFDAPHSFSLAELLRLFRRLYSEPPDLLTTTLVVAEGHGWFLKRYDRARALQFLSPIEDMTPLRLVAVGPDEHAGGVRRS